MGHEVLILCVGMFYTAVWYVFNFGENKEPKIDGFGAIFGGIEFTQMANNFLI